MTTALGIAAVTAVIKDLLLDGIIDGQLSALVGDVTVTALPPDRIATGNDEKSQLNIFLYNVTMNPGWRNAALPSRDQKGERVSNPPLALDLHYLLTAYGAEEFHAEILLGYAMQLLHETPALSRDGIRTTLAGAGTLPGDLPPALRALSSAELAEQIEQIKITPQMINTEELSKLWSALQAHYRPTAAYQASVVLIESKRSFKSSLPIRRSLFSAIHFRQPVIERVEPQIIPYLPDAKITLWGMHLLAEDMQVWVGDLMTTIDPNPTDTQLVVPLPDGLTAGMNAVQVKHPLRLGDPPVLHNGFDSNAAAFILSPVIQKKTKNGELVYDIEIVNVQDLGNDLRSADVTVKIDPPAGRSQRVQLLLNETDSPNGNAPRAYSLSAPTRSVDSTDTITLPVTNIHIGDYLVRMRVDGAESPLDVDMSGLFVKPKLKIE